jgi:phage/plasmid-like protein (TIGR03299 family)
MSGTNHAVALRKPGETPWMGLPAYTTPGGETPLEMAAKAGLLGWDVQKREIVTDAEPVDGKDFEILANVGGPTEPRVRLGIGRERYTTVQNEQFVEMADFATDGDARSEVMGWYRGGRNVFMSFTLGDNIVLDPEGQADEIGRFLHLFGSHDGTSGIVACTSNLRLACQNQITSAKHSALSTFKMRHTTNVEGRMLDVRQALGIAFKANDAFEKEMQALIEVEMNAAKFWNLVQNIYPKPEKDVRGSVKKWENHTDTIMGLWSGETNSGLEDTAYKAYNALNEDLMWYGGIRAGNEENALLRASGFDKATNDKNLGLYKAVLLAA